MTADGRKPSETNDFRGVVTAGGNGCARRADGPRGRSGRLSDRDFLSRHAAEIDELVNAVRALPDVRCDKVAAIRKAVESGAYVVNAALVAQKMIDEMQ